MLEMRAGLELFVLVLYLNFFSSNCWDIGVAVRDRIEFTTASGEVLDSVSDTMTEVSGLAYNAELNHMYFVDNERAEGSVFQLSLPQDIGADSGDSAVKPVVTKQAGVVMGVVYDPMTGVLYWTTGLGGEVWWLQVNTTGGAQAGQPLFSKQRLRGQTPVGLAIDVCKRYLYWTNLKGELSTIERSSLSGTERRTIVSTGLKSPNAVTVDQDAGRIYWVDQMYGGKFKVESSDLHGNDRKELLDGNNHEPFALVVAAEFVFWADHTNRRLWKIPVNASHGSTAPQFVREYGNSPQALVSREVGTWHQGHCDPVVRPRTVVKPADIIPLDEWTERRSTARPEVTHKNYTLCLHGGMYASTRGVCSCPEGYSGEHCEVDECRNYCVRGQCSPGPSCHCEEGFTGPRCDRDACYNFCLQGTCHIGWDGQPECRCSAGYSGVRCETRLAQQDSDKNSDRGVTSVCHNYCVMGNCSVDITGQPRCHCLDGFAGDRCEVNYTQQQELRDGLRDLCKELCLVMEQSSKHSEVPFSTCNCAEYELLPPLGSGSDSSWSHDSTVIALVGFCSLLMVAVGVLTRRVFVLRRRPRVKKRIIVSKNVTPTPMTCRPAPAQECHEITIENCCNMNICETPCYEPEFRQPEATLSRNNRGGKDEKKSLLGNMELPPDDLY